MFDRLGPLARIAGIAIVMLDLSDRLIPSIVSLLPIAKPFLEGKGGGLLWGLGLAFIGIFLYAELSDITHVFFRNHTGRKMKESDDGSR